MKLENILKLWSFELISQQRFVSLFLENAQNDQQNERKHKKNN